MGRGGRTPQIIIIIILTIAVTVTIPIVDFKCSCHDLIKGRIFSIASAATIGISSQHVHHPPPLPYYHQTFFIRRTCDTAPTLSNWNSSILRSFFETDSELESHLTKANSFERGKTACPDSNVRRHLNITEDCLEKTNDGSIILNWFNTNFLPYDTDNFCLDMKDDRMEIELCVPKSQQKFK